MEIVQLGTHLLGNQEVAGLKTTCAQTVITKSNTATFLLLAGCNRHKTLPNPHVNRSPGEKGSSSVLQNGNSIPLH